MPTLNAGRVEKLLSLPAAFQREVVESRLEAVVVARHAHGAYDQLGRAFHPGEAGILEEIRVEQYS